MSEHQRYAAKLLFQFRERKGGRSNQRRRCEERIVLLMAPDADTALRDAKRRGKLGEVSWSDGDKRVFLEFVGVLDLLDLGLESEPDEVWWEFRYLIRPRERRAALIPPKSQLTAFRWPKLLRKK